MKNIVPIFVLFVVLSLFWWIIIRFPILILIALILTVIIVTIKLQQPKKD